LTTCKRKKERSKNWGNWKGRVTIKMVRGQRERDHLLPLHDKRRGGNQQSKGFESGEESKKIEKE